MSRGMRCFAPVDGIGTPTMAMGGHHNLLDLMAQTLLKKKNFNALRCNDVHCCGPLSDDLP